MGSCIEKWTKLRIKTPQKSHICLPYISDLITVKLKSSYNLRSNSSLLPEPPKEKMLSTLGARSFYDAALCLWNSLPAELQDIQSFCSFKQKL